MYIYILSDQICLITFRNTHRLFFVNLSHDGDSVPRAHPNCGFVSHNEDLVPGPCPYNWWGRSILARNQIRCISLLSIWFFTPSRAVVSHHGMRFPTSSPMIQTMLLILSPINRSKINDKYPSAPFYGFLHQPPTPPTNKQRTLLDRAHTIVTGINKVQDTGSAVIACILMVFRHSTFWSRSPAVSINCYRRYR